MLLKNELLEQIVRGEISVVFRVWTRPTVKSGGTLTTQKGVLSIETVEKMARDDVTEADLESAGLASHDDLPPIDRPGEFYKISLKYKGADPRIALRQNVDPKELKEVCDRLGKMGDWTTQYLQMIHEQPNTHAQILAESAGIEKPKFKSKVRRLKALGLTESLRAGYRLSPRGMKILSMLNIRGNR